MSNRVGYWLAVLVLLLAAGLRLWNFNDLPSGFSDPEINTIRLAETARQGTVTILFEDSQGNGHEMLFPTLLAVTTTPTGNGLMGYRIVSVWLNMVALALVYSLGVRLFGRIAGLSAMLLLAVSFWSVLLSRLVVDETTIPLLVVTLMLALARAVPVYRVARQESTTTAAFASLGFVIALALYVHPAGLLLAMGAMIFIIYVLITRRPIERQRLSYIGFSVLIVLILTIPYLVFNVNRPELSASGRLIGDYNDIFQSVVNGILGVFWRGDANPMHNLPLRPLFEPITMGFILVGILITLRNVRYSRYMMVLVFFVVLSPIVLLRSASPNFMGLTAWLVPLVLWFGVGVNVIYRQFRRFKWFYGFAILALLSANLVWTAGDLFLNWKSLPSVQTAFHSDLHQLAQHLDETMGEIPTIICYPQFATEGTSDELSNTRKMVLMMNRRTFDNVRFADCNIALIFTQGGDREQIIFPEADGFATMPEYLKSWVIMGHFMQGQSVPDQRVVILTVDTVLANRLGAFTSTDPANYGYETTATQQTVVFPPIRFGGNITWLGYEPDKSPQYRVGDQVDVVNFWRVDSTAVPQDLFFFTHILSDPVTIADNRDFIGVDVALLQERDIFVQLAQMQLQPTFLPGRYQISIGAYQRETGARLPVFDDGQVRQGDRLILYEIEVVE